MLPWYAMVNVCFYMKAMEKHPFRPHNWLLPSIIALRLSRHSQSLSELAMSMYILAAKTRLAISVKLI